MSGAKSVSRHEEASASGGSFAPQGGLIAQQNLAIRVGKTTCHGIVIRVVLPRPQVVLNKRICGPYKTTLWSYLNNGLNCVT